ncbi:TrmB family transcriptional regulator [Nonomuraea lactucae]|uniref:TrmB family transcriptional regulator n=1 Tax=Nonomuraea lactucae TaxID=2249762 RepID=UPI0019631172|nr:hypothetical protein [Nonomuraea lactucae]
MGVSATVGMPTLGGLGVPPQQEQLYTWLLGHPYATMRDVAVAMGWRPARVRRCVRSLESLGLLTTAETRPMRLVPAAPDVAIELLALERLRAIDHARLGAARLAEEYRAALGVDERLPIRVIRDREAIAHQFFQTQRTTRHEVLILDRPPYVVDPVDRQSEVQYDLLDRGVAYRTIYDQAARSSPRQLALVRDLARRGERSRVPKACRSSCSSATAGPDWSRWSWPWRTRSPCCAPRRCLTAWSRCSRRCGIGPSRSGRPARAPRA